LSIFKNLLLDFIEICEKEEKFSLKKIKKISKEKYQEKKY